MFRLIKLRPLEMMRRGKKMLDPTSLQRPFPCLLAFTRRMLIAGRRSSRELFKIGLIKRKLWAKLLMLVAEP